MQLRRHDRHLDGRRREIAARIAGDAAGLKPSELKALERLAGRRYPPAGGCTPEQAHELAALSRLLSRQIGLVLDRQGKVSSVIIGDARSVRIPDIPGERGAGRLRGLRLFHTHLSPELLTREDLMDLLFLRLDAVTVMTVDEWGGPVRCQSAWLLPPEPGGEQAGPHVEADVPWDRVTTDFAALATALEDEFGRVAGGSVSTEAGEAQRALLVSVSPDPRPVQEAHLQELAELARTNGMSAAGTMVQRVASLHPRRVLGEAKMAELEVMALQERAGVVIFDGELSPAQMACLSGMTERRVMDRTQLILEIFAGHAVTGAGKLQVELANLQYSLPRLAGSHRSMDRLSGGIYGNKGRGETRLELERRNVRERMARLRRELEELRRRRFHTRARRVRQGLPLAALVGYTNAGKSSLLNMLTNGGVKAEDKLFATLDPATRRMRFPEERELVLADTVGFIRDLPRELHEAFRATLEELRAADVLIHVVDASHSGHEQQIASVEKVLEDMELSSVPRITVLNKWDAVPLQDKASILASHPGWLPVSAKNGAGVARLAAAIEKLMFEDGAWRRRDPSTWEEFFEEERRRDRRKRDGEGDAGGMN